MTFKKHNQKGNALWFILVAIGLLGLLTVMMSRSSSISNETGSYEQNIIIANEILSYAKSIENAVQNLLARGCSENDLSFWHDSDDNGTEDGSDDYYNANSPTDHSCHVFDVAGAGMAWEDAPDSIYYNDTYGQYSFTTKPIGGGTTIMEHGVASRPDLYFHIRGRLDTGWPSQKRFVEICKTINKQLDIPEYPNDNGLPMGMYFTYKFIGQFDDGSGTTSKPELDGLSTYCSTENANYFDFQHLLITR